jgi:hypothetical protein
LQLSVLLVQLCSLFDVHANRNPNINAVQKAVGTMESLLSAELHSEEDASNAVSKLWKAVRNAHEEGT